VDISGSVGYRLVMRRSRVRLPQAAPRLTRYFSLLEIVLRFGRAQCAIAAVRSEVLVTVARGRRATVANPAAQDGEPANVVNLRGRYAHL
jgi:hypothetical protein